MPPNVSTSTPASIVNERSAPTDELERSGGVGDAGAVHVHLHPQRMRCSLSAATSAAVYTVPSSVLGVIDTTAGWTWCP